MQLKLKLAAIASTMLLAASLGVVLAGPASAAQEARLCVSVKDSSYCAEALDMANSSILLAGDMETNAWDTPGALATTQIRYYGSPGKGQCMELHTNDTVILATCQGKASEEWTALSGAAAHTTVFMNKDNPGLCLTAETTAPAGDGRVADARACNPKYNAANQEWLQVIV